MSSANFHVNGLHHAAWRCRDAEETRAFYEDLLGLPLAHVVREDRVPSTGESCAFAHVFFRMRDGSFIAFFDLKDGQGAQNPSAPAWVTHIALRVDSREELERARQRLIDAHVHVIGIVDHDWLQSIYFHDPNGLRLELAYQVGGAATTVQFEQKAHSILDQWTVDKKAVHAASERP